MPCCVRSPNCSSSMLVCARPTTAPPRRPRSTTRHAAAPAALARASLGADAVRHGWPVHLHAPFAMDGLCACKRRPRSPRPCRPRLLALGHRMRLSGHPCSLARRRVRSLALPQSPSAAACAHLRVHARMPLALSRPLLRALAHSPPRLLA
jgi:hypothetical protein